MKRVLLLMTAVLIIGPAVRAQFSEMIKKSEVHGSFEFDGAYYMADNGVGITDSMINGKNFAFNGFGKITYTLGKFSAGLRYEAYLPPLAGFDPRAEGQGFPYLWAMYTTEKFSFTVGNFYEQFGNGLTLRTYEEWQLGYDNALNGARVTYEPIKGLMLKGVYGMQRFYWAPYTKNSRGIVKGFDAEMDFNQVIKAMNSSKVRLTLGGSFVSKYQADQDPLYKLPRNVGNMAGRLTFGMGRFNLSTEYAYKINDPSAINNFIYKEGMGFLVSATYSTKGFGLYAMFKRYDNMSYKSNRAIVANGLDINFLPPSTEIHTYMLTAMYPYNTQPNGEIGFQFQMNYKVPKKSKLGGKYGIGIAINYSQVNDIVRDPVNVPGTDTTAVDLPGTDGWTSPFFKFGDRVFWQDLNIEIDKKFSKKFKGAITYMYQSYDIATLEGHTGAPIVYSNIAVVEMTYKFTSKNALRWELQGLWTERDKGDWVAALAEFTMSPHWFITVSDQYNYGNPDEEKKIHYYTGSFGYTRRTTRIAITYGRQREGIVCVGGVCRAVPASSGFYVTISSSF